jgi:uncharacterized protein
MSSPSFYTGSPLDPSDLNYRDDFIKDAWDALRNSHVVLTAPRRTGKTSVMEFLRERPQEAYMGVYVFVQDLDHPAEFILSLLDAFHDRHPKLLRAVMQKTKTAIGSALEKIGEVEVSGFKLALRHEEKDWRENWKKHGDAFLEQLRVGKHRVLFLIDEFPDMILNIKKSNPGLVNEFLAWLRGHRIKPRPTQDCIRWLIGGSVNLSGTLNAMGCVDLVNDMITLPLPPLTDSQVQDFVGTMLSGHGVEFDPSLPALVSKRIGRPIPIFMQLVTQELYRLWKSEKKRLTIIDVDRVFGELVVSVSARDKLQHYHSRIRQYYEEPNKSAAYEILGRLSTSTRGLKRTTLFKIFEQLLQEKGASKPQDERRQLFNQLMQDLENDFYVSETHKNCYDFVSGLIKSWWRKYYA